MSMLILDSILSALQKQSAGWLVSVVLAIVICVLYRELRTLNQERGEDIERMVQALTASTGSTVAMAAASNRQAQATEAQARASEAIASKIDQLKEQHKVEGERIRDKLDDIGSS